MNILKNKVIAIFQLFKLILELRARHVFAMLILVVSVFSCSKEQAVPVVADFTYTAIDNDYSIPVKIKILNTTVGAESYQWTFEGANRTSSKDRNPGTLVYNTKGTYKIILKASNTDGVIDSKELEFSLDDPIEIDFETEIQTNNFAPATVVISNKTKGATTFQWSFEGGNPATSYKEQPVNVVFSEPGDHTIKLTVGNGREIHELEKTITVRDALMADFDWKVAFQDDDFQAPVTLTLQNKSRGALKYDWVFSDGMPRNNTKENPIVIFNQTGMHTLTLTVSNEKETKTISKFLEVLKNTNLRTFNDIKLGIGTAHNANSVGAFFSATTREVYTKAQVNSVEGNLIDVVFFGLGSNFSFNKFVSPDALVNTSFEPITNASKTLFINSLEQCECTASLSVAEFESMVDDAALRPLIIEETDGGKQDFNDTQLPRIVLFKTADGRKGAIKIKEYVKDGQNSYINTDIKIQKESK